MDFDVLIVGAGPAGLSAAIRLGQLNQQQQSPLSICVIEKGAYVGAHILGGAVIEPSALDQLLPEWSEKARFPHTAVSQDEFLFLTQRRSWSLPIPAILNNRGNYIISLGLFCQWLAEQAETLGINIFPGFAATEIIFSPEGRVLGVQTGDKGLNADRTPGSAFQPGINVYAQQTLLAEGCRGSLSEQIMRHFNLRQKCDPQSYGLGIKEIWEVDSPAYQPGLVTHTQGWPLDKKTYGGGFIYHETQNRVALGFVVGLDYSNPYLDPFQELQRFKTHPRVRTLLTGGKCIAYGAKSLNEGGWQAVPQLTFPGGLLVGCGAGFLNVGKIKGIHNAMWSGMIAAEAIMQTEAEKLNQQISIYSEKMAQSCVMSDLHNVRNLRPGFHYGFWAGMTMAAIDQYIFRGHAPWTLHYPDADYTRLKPADYYAPIQYPKPDGKLTFDKLTQVYLSGTRHRESEPCHLILKNPQIPVQFNLKQFAGPEQRYCPAAVYEFVVEDKKTRLQINAANCLHCKACDIKDPSQNILWTPPEGGDGPNYTDM